MQLTWRGEEEEQRPDGPDLITAVILVANFLLEEDLELHLQVEADKSSVRYPIHQNNSCTLK